MLTQKSFFNSLLILFSCSLVLGSLIAVGVISNSSSRKRKDRNLLTSLATSNNSRVVLREMIVIVLALICFGYLLSIIYAQKGVSLAYFFLPSRYVMTTQYYFEALYRLLPLSVGIFFTLRARRFSLVAKFFFAIALLASFSLAQRRDIMVVLLSILALILILNDTTSELKMSIFLLSKPQLRYFRKLAVVLAILTAMIPVLWYARSISTSLIRDSSFFPAPWEKRSFLELMARSPGSGFESYLAIRRMVDESGTIPLYSFTYPLFVWIPRGLWPEKPPGIQGFVVEYYGLIEHPSIFLPGDLYINFGPSFFWFGAALIGFALTYISLRCHQNKDFLNQTLWIVTFSNLPTLIKNGVCGFVGQFGFTMFLLLIIYTLVQNNFCEN